MITMNTILCPVDFSRATARQAALAASIARLYGARLVFHHNLAALAPGAGVGWMWSADQPPDSHETVGPKLEDLAGATATGLEVELRITEGPASPAVLAVSEAVNADLLVLTTHQATNDDHTSVTAQVLDHTRRSVLALHEATLEPHALSFDPGSGQPQVTLVPTDLTAESRAAVEFAFELGRTLPLELRLLHFTSHRLAEARTDIERALKALVPTDLLARTHVHVRDGEPSRGIVDAANDLGASCIVMGEHTRAPLRRWFSHDTSRGVLHDAPCPVWYVPGSAAA